MASLVLATRNPHKLREFARMLAPGDRRAAARTASSCRPRTATTFAENALPKARAAAAATGRPAIADDSGIAAAALGGAPGVRSARFAGEHATDEENLAKLIARGAGRERAGLRVRDRLRRPGAGVERLFEGGCERPYGGRRAGARAASAMTPCSCPTASRRRGRWPSCSAAEKDAISHRGRASRPLVAWLRPTGQA